MVVGLDVFARYFAGLEDRYALIGGSAATVLMERAGIPFRATRDLDIVFFIETMDSDVVRQFWTMVTEGRYRRRERGDRREIRYRFLDPEEAGYPQQLELFSRCPDDLVIEESSHLLPIAVAEPSHLSAILLDDEYYEFLKRHVIVHDGLSLADAPALIALKARAWIDLHGRAPGELHVDEKDIRKHRNDVLRLSQILAPEMRVAPPSRLQKDVFRFLDEAMIGVDKQLLRNIGVAAPDPNEVVKLIREVFSSP